MFSMLLSFFFSVSSPTLEELPVAHVEQIAQEVMAELSHATPIKPTLTVTHRPEPTPLGALRYASGRCKLVINTNEQAWAQWGRFLNEDNKAEWDNIIRASVAHEVGHCMPEQSRSMVQINLSQETLNALARSDGHVSGAHARVLREELFADTVAILYAKEYLDEPTAAKVISSMLDARTEYGHSDPTHDTSRELNRILEQNGQRLPEETFGQAAARLLSNG